MYWAIINVMHGYQHLYLSSCLLPADLIRQGEVSGARDRRKPKAGTMPYSYFECLQGFFIVHSTTQFCEVSIILDLFIEENVSHMSVCDLFIISKPL